MIRKSVLMTLAAMLLIGGATKAQRPNVNKPIQKPNEKKVVRDNREEGEMFIGMIVYEAKMNKGMKKEEMRGRNNEPQAIKNQKADFKVGDPKSKIKPEKLNAFKNRVHATFTKEGSYLNLGDFYFCKMLDKPPLISTHFDNIAIGTEQKELFKTDPNNRSESMNKSQFYYRTKESKEIAGLKAIKYICKLPMNEGELWVCEDYFVAGDFTPFCGMIYPVLEGNVNIVIDGKCVECYSIKAVEVVKEKIDEKLVKMAEPMEFMPPRDLLERLQEKGYHID